MSECQIIWWERNACNRTRVDKKPPTEECWKSKKGEKTRISREDQAGNGIKIELEECEHERITAHDDDDDEVYLDFEIQQVTVNLVVNIGVILLLAQVQPRNVHGGVDDGGAAVQVFVQVVQHLPQLLHVPLVGLQQHGLEVHRQPVP